MSLDPSPSGVPPVLSSPLPEGRPVNRRGWWIQLLLLGAYITLVGIVGRMRSLRPGHMPLLSHTTMGLLMVCITELCLFFLVLGLAVKASGASRDDLWLHWRRGFRPIAMGIGYSVALRMAIYFLLFAASLILVLTRAVTPEALQEFFAENRPNLEALIDISAMRQNTLYFWVSLTVVSFVVAGLREELWRSAFLAGLRTLWPRHFDTPMGRVTAVAFTAMLFGLAHLSMGWMAVLIAGGLGLGLGAIMMFHRSIWPAVIAHGMFDATSLAVLPWLAETLQKYQPTLGH